MHSATSLLPWLALAARLGAAASSHLLPRQDDTGYGNCKETSFSHPAWYFWDPMYVLLNGTTFGDFGVAVVNTANGGDFICVAENVELAPGADGPWLNCSTSSTQFRPNLTSMTVEFRETWSCPDNPEVNFVASGFIHLSAPEWCDTGDSERGHLKRCGLVNADIIPALSSPVKIEPSVPWLPYIPYEYPTGCAGRSEYPTWQIDGLFYDHTLPAQSLTLKLTNLGNGVQVSCFIGLNMTLTRSTAHTERWLDCNSDSNSDAIKSTQIVFDRDYGILGIRQTWNCPAKLGTGQPSSTFGGLGYLTTGLVCTEPSRPSAGAFDDDTGYTCSLPSTNMTGYPAGDYPTKMPHTSYTHSCLMYSLNTTAMVLNSFTIEESGQPSKAATFRIYNPGPGDEYELSMSIQDDGSWRACDLNAASLPWQLVSCQYRVDQQKNVGFKLQWACDDRDPSNPVVFSATMGGKLSEKTSLGISDLTWRSSNIPMTKGPTLPWI